jgi:transcriptional regulator NrdR family protein
MKLVVKRNGRNQDFDVKKLYASVFAACIAVKVLDEQAELIAENVSNNVVEELSDRESIRSSELSEIIYKHLENFEKDAAFLYFSHRNVA